MWSQGRGASPIAVWDFVIAPFCSMCSPSWKQKGNVHTVAKWFCGKFWSMLFWGEERKRELYSIHIPAKSDEAELWQHVQGTPVAKSSSSQTTSNLWCSLGQILDGFYWQGLTWDLFSLRNLRGCSKIEKGSAVKMWQLNTQPVFKCCSYCRHFILAAWWVQILSLLCLLF